MPLEPIWSDPDPDKLRQSAKLLRDLVRAGDGNAVAQVAEHHPRLGDLTPHDSRCPGLALSDAQLTVARRHGLPSWPALMRHVAVLRDNASSPHRVAVPADDLVGAFSHLACLHYGDDDPGSWNLARALLDQDPSLAAATPWAAAVAGDATALAAHLETGAPVDEPGGPRRWPLLLYAAYSRLPGADTVPVITLLLAAGADPDAGFLWDGNVPPFTALTGVLGRGEQRQPPHPRALDAARLLLEAGGDANDGQAIYNHGPGDHPSDDTDVFELLIQYGLGRGDGGPWFHRLAPRLPTPAQLLGEALQHSAERGLVARTRLLLDAGADPDGTGIHPAFGGRTAYQGAVLHGQTEVVRLLEEAGADPDQVDPLTRFIGACLAGDRAAAARLAEQAPELPSRAVAARPDTVALAAGLGRPGAVELAAELGFDVNAGPVTALHEAAFAGRGDVVDALLVRGADATVVEPRFGATPAGWARHAGHHELADRLDRAAAGPGPSGEPGKTDDG